MNPRIPKINQLLQEELGAILLRELELPDGVLVTVTRVDASGNLQEAENEISLWFKKEEIHDYTKKDWEVIH